MIDVLQKLAVDPLVDRSRNSVRIDGQDSEDSSGVATLSMTRAALKSGGLDTTDRAPTALPPIEPMRKLRLFIREESRVRISLHRYHRAKVFYDEKAAMRRSQRYI